MSWPLGICEHQEYCDILDGNETFLHHSAHYVRRDVGDPQPFKTSFSYTSLRIVYEHEILPFLQDYSRNFWRKHSCSGPCEAGVATSS
jgi:hypothetical protein